MDTINVLWVVVLFVVGLGEGIAVADRKRGNTISENAWKMRSTALGRFILWPGFMWLNYHILLSTGGFGWPDGVAIGIGLVVASIAQRRQKQ